MAPHCKLRRDYKLLLAQARSHFFSRLGAIQRGGLPNKARGASLVVGGGGGGD